MCLLYANSTTCKQHNILMSELQEADASLPKLTSTFSTGANPAIVKTYGSSIMLVCAEMHGTDAAICGVKFYTASRP